MPKATAYLLLYGDHIGIENKTLLFSLHAAAVLQRSAAGAGFRSGADTLTEISAPGQWVELRSRHKRQ